MQGNEIHQAAIATAELLAASACSYPFGPEHQVFKVADKIFLLLTERHGEKIVTLKCREQDGELHRAIYDSIRPGYHMNKRHWITVWPGEKISAALISQLVEESYRLVLEGVPKYRRPKF
ncbi:MmcQ/YjbR family DNA-binding protein [Erwinia sp. E602]|uniref:MmcQ/YjbR family DNA-binding protein n=1 Tax=unclassified Erwinia TaxID=2622719 RepID=UPI0006F47D49|nr:MULTISPECIES: MmcQ/YjbR family DNA-binding protein [unclassified Erwinia]KQN53405.1 cytoplasmic protein [Erwinia sp. Leaf53]PLV61942.1 cytoplasmic protein [Erwinia sp. B116]QUG75670.1 MmcQ/YjbR family DNA-binding protein [Erwinia sp. E602]